MRDWTPYYVAIAIVAILGISAYAIWLGSSTAPSSSQCGSSLERLGQALPSPPLLIESPTNNSKGTAHWYNFTIEYSSQCDTIGSLMFKVRSSTGSEVGFPGGAAVQIVGPSGLRLAAYNLSSDAWTYSPGDEPNTVIVSQDLVSLYYSGESPSTLAGCSLTWYGTSWSVTAVIT